MNPHTPAPTTATTAPTTTTAGQCLVATLAAHGIDRLFCVPGESYLGLLDALHAHPTIDTVVCRHESGAGFMALADARLSGRPGVAAVSRGPGASNAAIAVHTAQQDAIPFLLLIGQVATRDLRRDAFQEIDYGRMFGGIAKWTAEVADPARLPETLRRAFQVMTTGTPGPVVLSLPEDMLTAPLDAAQPQPPVHLAPVHLAPSPAAPSPSAPPPALLAELRTVLAAAERPLLLAGSGLDHQGGREALQTFAETWSLPVLAAFRRQDLFPNAHPLYAGDMGLQNPAAQMELLHTADLLVVLGARMSDITTQNYSFPGPTTPLVHIHADPAAIGTQFPTALAIAAPPAAALALIGPPSPATAPPPAPRREEWLARLRAERARITAPRLPPVADGIPFEAVVLAVAAALPKTAILTLDAGSFAAPAYRVIPFAPPQRLLAPISGAMGFGIPAAVAAALRHPGRTVICMVGDGGFLMTGNELAVALERRLPLKVILAENGTYGSIRIHQERDYPGRPSGTGFTNPDFTLIGQAFGCHVTRLDTQADLPRLPALLASPGPEFVLVRTSVAATLPRTW